MTFRQAVSIAALLLPLAAPGHALAQAERMESVASASEPDIPANPARVPASTENSPGAGTVGHRHAAVLEDTLPGESDVPAPRGQKTANTENVTKAAHGTAKIRRSAPTLQKARSVDLGEPISEQEAMHPAESVDADDGAIPLKPATFELAPLVLLGTEVPPLTSTRLSWTPAQSFEGLASPTPVLVVHGARPGPVLCLTGAIHGDELNGIEIVRRVLYNIKPEDLSGSIIGVPIVNLQGFQRSSRYLPDRRDLNRLFPGYPKGSSGARIAHSFFKEIISHCTVLVDLHTGSFHRSNLPQLRADLTRPKVLELTQGFGATVVLQSKGATGTLRRAAVDSGIAAVVLEAGEPMRVQETAVKHSVKSIHTLLNYLGMVKTTRFWGKPEPVYYRSTWVRADQGGILFSEVKLGGRVNKGDLLGAITNPITNVRNEILSPYDGRVLGMALNQVVMPGFAAFHIGIRAPEEVISVTESEQAIIPRNDDESKLVGLDAATNPGPPPDPDASSAGEDEDSPQPLDEPFDSN